MATELTINAAKQLLTLSLKPHELDKHRAAIGIEVEAALNNGGYWIEPSSQLVKMKMLMKWMDALQNYSIEEIERAFSQHVMSNPNRKPNEGFVYNIIVANRQRITNYAAQEPEPERKTPQQTMTPERRQEIMAEVEKSHGKLKSFNEKVEAKT